MASVREGEVESLKNYCKMISERLGLSVTHKLSSLIEDFDKQRISLSELRNSIRLLLEETGQEYDHILEEGEIREDRLLLRGPKVAQTESNRLEGPKSGTHVMVDEEITRICGVFNAELSPSAVRALVSLIEDFWKFRIGHSEFNSSFKLLFERKRPLPRGDRLAVRAKKSREYPIPHGERESEKHVTNLEGKKRIILRSEPVERTRKIPRKSERLDGMTPSYRLIPEEERVPVKDDRVLSCLNNTCALADEVVGDSGDIKLTRHEEAMAICEDDMFERDIEIGALRSAVDRAEKVRGEEMRVKDLGVKFYRCIKKLFRRDMHEAVRQYHKQVLPQILTKLKRKLSELTAARDRKKPGWKQIFEVNTTAKQRENAPILRKKHKAKQQI